MKSAWIWLPCLFIISNRRWSATLSHIKGSKILINQYKPKSFEIQLFLNITKYQPSEISLLIYCIFIYLFLNIKIKAIVLSAILIHLIFVIYFYFFITILYFYILLRYISIFIIYFLPMLNPDSSIFYIFERL